MQWRQVCALLVMLAACGREPEPAVRRVRLLPTQPASTQPAAREARVVRGLEVPPDGRGWTVTSASSIAVTTNGTGAQRALVLAGRERGLDVRVAIPGPFDAAECNALAVRVASPRTALLEGRFIAADGSASTAAGQTIRRTDAGEAPPVVMLEFPGNLAERRTFDTLELHLVATAERIGLARIELLERPLAAWLPDPEQEPELVAVAGESRRAVGLSSRRPLASQPLYVERESELALAWALPPELRGRAPRPRLVVALSARGRADRVETFALDDSAEAAWGTAQLELEPFAGREMTVRFTLETDDPEREHACALAEPVVLRRAPHPPTVLLVTSDTHRADHLGSMNGVELATPVLDALASRGVLFLDCFSTTNNTNPSHIALLTGITPRDSGVTSNFVQLSEDATTLPELFRDAGWLTYGVVGVRKLGYGGHGLAQGFDRFSIPAGIERHAGESVAELMEWLHDARGVPLFVWLHVFDPHAPYAPPGSTVELTETRDDTPGASGPRFDAFPARQYSAEIATVDAALAPLLEKPRFQEGVVALTGDHGESLGEQGILWSHAGLAASTLRVPLILVWPDAPRGMRTRVPVSNERLGRTLLDLAGLADVPFEGASLLRALEGSPRAPPRFALGANAQSASVERDGWLFVLHLEAHDVPGTHRERHAAELYDLAHDPHGVHDVLAREMTRAKELRALLGAWLAAAEPRGWGEPLAEDAELAADLAALGYAQGAEPKSGTVLLDPDCRCERCSSLR